MRVRMRSRDGQAECCVRLHSTVLVTGHARSEGCRREVGEREIAAGTHRFSSVGLPGVPGVAGVAGVSGGKGVRPCLSSSLHRNLSNCACLSRWASEPSLSGRWTSFGSW